MSHLWGVYNKDKDKKLNNDCYKSDVVAFPHPTRDTCPGNLVPSVVVWQRPNPLKIWSILVVNRSLKMLLLDVTNTVTMGSSQFLQECIIKRASVTHPQAMASCQAIWSTLILPPLWCHLPCISPQIKAETSGMVLDLQNSEANRSPFFTN